MKQQQCMGTERGNGFVPVPPQTAGATSLTSGTSKGDAGWRQACCLAPYLVFMLVLLLVAAGCDEIPIGRKQEAPDTSRLVVVGDSLSAGHQNSCMLETQQPWGYANQVAGQMGASLTLPLVGAPGAPPCLTLLQTGNPLSIVRSADPNDFGQYGQRTNPGATVTNLSIPGTRVVDAVWGRDQAFFTAIQYPYEYLHRLVLAPDTTMIEEAEALHPTTVIMWLGSNDALWAAITGSTQVLTPPLAFERAYSEAIRRMKKTGARVIVANVPDPTVIPHLFPAELVLAWFGTNLETVGGFLGLATGDRVTQGGLAELAAALQQTPPAPLSDQAVTSAAEMAEISAAVVKFNQIIALNAFANNALMVDINALLSDVHENGVDVGGAHLTTDFCGGVFTLDGIHPTNVGYAVTANEFIAAMNERFGTNYPAVDTAAVLASEPMQHFCVAAN